MGGDSMPERTGHLPRKPGARRWIVVLIIIVVLAGAGIFAYHLVKAHRANSFASAGDSLRKAGKLNDAAIQYRVALQLDPQNYPALSGAARLASQADRP